VVISRLILEEYTREFSEYLETDVAIIGGMFLSGKRAAELIAKKKIVDKSHGTEHSRGVKLGS